MTERAPCTCGECPVHAGERDGRGHVCEARRAARSQFQEFLGEYFDAAHRRGNLLVKGFAATWEVSRQQVERWGNVKHVGSPLAAGDLEALPPRDLLALLEAWVERVRAKLAPALPADDPRLLVIQQSRHVGTLAGRIEAAVLPRSPGGTRITSDEWAEIDDRLAEQERTVRDQRRAVAAAREASR